MGDLVGQVQDTPPQLGQIIRILTGKGVFFLQTPHLAQAKVPGQSSYLSRIRRHPRSRLADPARVGLKFISKAVVTGPAMIDFDLIAWDDEDDPRGNVQQIAA